MTETDSHLSGNSRSPLDAARAAGWQALPARAHRLFVLSGPLALPPAAFAAWLAVRIFNWPLGWGTVVGFALAAAVLVAWLGHRRYRYTAWRLDDDGFSIRRGKLWESHVRVPINRVQHLDLRRGPLERRFRLATLIIHTAGTRNSAVHVGGLADADAEALRDLLARQAELERAHPQPRATEAVPSAPGANAPTAAISDAANPS